MLVAKQEVYFFWPVHFIVFMVCDIVTSPELLVFEEAEKTAFANI